MNKNSDLMSTYSPGSVPHYGDKADPYEAIKVIRAWGLNFSLGNVLKYVARAGKKPGASRRKMQNGQRFTVSEDRLRLGR